MKDPLASSGPALLSSEVEHGHTVISTSAPASLRQMRVWEAVVTVSAAMLSPFLQPSVFAHTGWTLGVAFILFSSVATYTTGVILGEICTLHPHLGSYPEVARAAFAGIAGDWLGLGEASQRRFSLVGLGVVQTAQFLAYYLNGVCQLVYLQQLLAQLLPHRLCQRTWLFIAGAACAPFMQIPTFREARWVSLVTLVMTFLAVGIAFYEIALVQPWKNCDPGPQYPRPTFTTAMSGLATLASAYGSANFPEVIREMAEPARWRSVMLWTYCMVAPMYLLLGLAGYYAYGGNAVPTLQDNAPRNWPNQASVGMMAAGEVYWAYTSVLVILLNTEIALGVDPAAWCSKSSGDGAVEMPACYEWLSLRKLGCPPAVFRLIFRTLFLGSELLLAQLLLGGDALFSIQSVTGAVGFLSLTYVLPLLFGWVLLPPQSSNFQFVYQGAVFVVCVVLFFIGTVTSFKGLVDAENGVSGDVPCFYKYEYYSGNSHGCAPALGNVSTGLHQSLRI